jgi:hypothetical protein
VKPDGHLADPAIGIGIALLAIGAGVIVMVVRALRSGVGEGAGVGSSSSESVAIAPGEAVDPSTDSDSSEGASHVSRMLAAGSVAAALLLIVVGRDLVLKSEGTDQPGAIRLLQLFTYNYRRGWPDALDFSAVLAAFTVIGIAMSLALAVKAVRRHAVAAMCAFAFVWGLWGLDVYMQRTAQHWGQHEVIAAYYANRESPAEQLVAYQMNWKGENFYTGNHVPAFVSTGSTFTTWLKKQKDAGVKVMYFITEHGRIGGLKSEVGAKAYREVTDKVLCNKFVLVRAEF